MNSITSIVTVYCTVYQVFCHYIQQVGERSSRGMKQIMATERTTKRMKGVTAMVVVRGQKVWGPIGCKVQHVWPGASL